MRSKVMIHLYRCDSIIQTCQNPLKLLNVSPLFLDPIEISLILKNIQCPVFTSPFGKYVLLSQLMCYSWCASKPVISLSRHRISRKSGILLLHNASASYWGPFILKQTLLWLLISVMYIAKQGCFCFSQLRDHMRFKTRSICASERMKTLIMKA